jgi:two-component system chemotaxis sensor kinase CheA
MMSDQQSQEPFDPAREELIDTPAVFAADESIGEKPTDEEGGVDSAGRQTSIRVHVSLLDSLMTLAGELVLSRNQLLQTINAGGLKSAEAVGQRIDLITSELQEAIMLTRMQPIGNVFGKFPRIVRDLAAQLDKNVDLSIFGKEVELDKTIIEAIGDPLTHLVRNAVDHGIEVPEVRRQRGKPETGSVVLRAFHEAGQVVIEIEDDGAGLDGDKLAALALRQGLVTGEQVQSMSDKEKVNLIFMPGFSSADTVTEISGRGVGMDVVKSNFDKLGGQIDITSETGKGTAISIKLPLTLAIIPCQVILTEGERYAIPQVNLEELLRIPAHLVKERIEIVGSAEVVRLRGKLLPLVRLADALGIERTYTDPDDGSVKIDRRRRIADRRSKQSPLTGTPGNPDQDTAESMAPARRESPDRRTAPDSALNIVVVSAGPITYGLIVDRLEDSEEIVIKPLGRHLQHCQGYAGATIMGDGRIALILDVANLATMAHLSSVDGSDRATEIQQETESQIAAAEDSRSVLIFRSSETEQFGIPLDQVERIEKIKRSDIEYLGAKRVMQYRDGSLHLICVDDIAQVQPLAEREDLLVIVFSFGTHSIGLLACGPIDTRDIAARSDEETLRQPGIAGSTIIGGQTTLLVDINEMVGQLYPEWF